MHATCKIARCDVIDSLPFAVRPTQEAWQRRLTGLLEPSIAIRNNLETMTSKDTKASIGVLLV
jgi:hypothetical protein